MARSKGEGSITQRPNGLWQGSLQVGGVRKTVYGKTRQEVARKLGELQRQAIDTGALADPGKRTLADLMDTWLTTATLKPRTIETYRQTARLYLLPALGSTRLDKLTPDRIQRLYAMLQQQAGTRAPAKAHAVLHRALKLAVLWRWLSENPADRVLRPAYHPERKRVWTPWELNAFLTRTQGHWLYPVWALAIATGARVGELLALSWDDVDAGSVRITKTLQRIGGEWIVTAPKTRAGARTVILPAEGLAALRTQRDQQAAWRAAAGDAWKEWPLVFTQWTGTPLHAATVSHGLRSMCDRLGLPPVTPHGLRHLHASLLLAGGLPIPAVSARLGHANASITMAVYAHRVGAQDETAADTIGAAMRAKGAAR